jgi:Tfp pilus assembly protein PilZ
MFNKNRRKFVRLKVHHLVKYKILDSAETLTFARNLSAGGIRFYCKEKIPKGSTVEMTINFPDSPTPLKILSKVVWIKELKKMGGFEVGAQFIDVDDDTFELLRKKIDNTFKIAHDDSDREE